MGNLVEQHNLNKVLCWKSDGDNQRIGLLFEGDCRGSLRGKWGGEQLDQVPKGRWKEGVDF